MLIPRFIALTLSAGTMALGLGMASGQTYPTKPIRMVSSGVGGTGDFLARLVAPGLSASLGQPVIIDNRGGSGVFAAGLVVKAPPDGYTLLSYGSAIWVEPLMLDRAPYDPVRDFSAITLVANSPSILVLHPLVALTSVKELIALAKAKPGVLNYASGATGAPPHLAAELFKALAGINIVRVPYKGAGLATNGLIGGEVQLMFATPASAAVHIRSGRLRALGVTSAQPSALAPGLPTIAASGLPGYEAVSIFGMFAPAKTPATIIHRLNQEIVRIVNNAEVKERLLNGGAEAVGSSPEEFAAAVKTEVAKWAKLIKEAGIRAD